MREERRKTITVEYLTENTEYDTSQFKYFMGIDPSYSSTGVVLLDAKENVPLFAVHIAAGKPKDDFHKRLQILLDKVNKCMVEYNSDDVYVVMEGASFSSDFNCFKLGKLSGVIEYYLAEHGYIYNLVAPTYAKKVATGKGTASKDAIKDAIQQRWGYSHSCDDINDAYVMAQIARGARPLPAPSKSKKRSTRKMKDDNQG